MFIKNCGNCGYRSLNPDKCPIIGHPYTDECCPYHTFELLKCGVCGKIIVSPNPIYQESADNTWIAVCESCFELRGTCGGCSKSTTCDFETNPSPIPKAGQKRIQQGNMITLMTVKSEERVAETCAKNCECFDHDNNSCGREFNTCRKYERKY